MKTINESAKSAPLAADLLVFAKVVEHGTFTAAARNLQMAKSQVTKQVRRLEGSLSVTLLHRTTRRLALTEAGSAVFEHAEAVARAADSAADVAGMHTAQASGRIRVTASVSYALHVLAPLLPGFCERHPLVAVEFVLVDRYVDLLEEGVDLAIRLTDAPPPGLAGRPLDRTSFVVCGAPAFLDSRQIRHPADLRDLPCFSFSAQARRSGAIWQFRRRAERVDVPVKAPVVANSSDMVRELVLRGMGLGLLPGFAVKEDLACGRLQPLLGEWEPTGAFGTAAWVLWQPQRVLPPKLRVFVDYLVEQLSTADDAVVAKNG